MSLKKILGEYTNWKTRLVYLKENSPYYPNVLELFDNKTKEVILSSLVRIFRHYRYYDVHVVQTIYCDKSVPEDVPSILYRQLILTVSNVQNLYILQDSDEASANQQDEQLRLIELNKIKS